MSDLDTFVDNLHHTSQLIVRGKAEVMGRTVDAALVRNLYGQLIVWGMFSVDKGKFKGKLANNANTEGVVFEADFSFPKRLIMNKEVYDYFLRNPISLPQR